MQRNGKQLIIGILIVVVLLMVVLGSIAAGRRTTLLESIPEGFWEDDVFLDYFPSFPYIISEMEAPIASIEITEEELKEVASNAEIWWVDEPGELAFPMFFSMTETEGKEYAILIGSSGYIKCFESTHVTLNTGNETEIGVEDWYWDGGKLFSFLLEKYVRVSSSFPESAWGTVEWTHYDAEETCIDAQGTCETEEAYELLQVAIETSTTSEISQEYDYFTLAVSNTEWDPNAEYLITVNEIGEVHFQLQNEDNQDEVYDVLNVYYEIDPGVFQELEEMLLTSDAE